jgi:hypothetical protein
MKVGDLVRMKLMMFWRLKDNPGYYYTEELFLVFERDYDYATVTLLDSKTNKKFTADVEFYDVVNCV